MELYISAPQMQPKQFYNGAEHQAPLNFTAVEGYCAHQVLPDMPTHSNPSPKPVYACVCLPFSFPQECFPERQRQMKERLF